MSKHHSVIIIGAGLSGLYAAWRLYQQGHNVTVLEARDRTGGRILSCSSAESDDSCIDLGPAWVWPQLQPELHKLITELDIGLFKQFTGGDMLYEAKAGQIERYTGQSSHAESYRINGGSQALIEALQSQLGDTCVQLNKQVTSIDQQSLMIQTTHEDEIEFFSADKIILALPPRLIVQSIAFNPPVEDELMQLWQNTPTWMAGHCKIVFTYQKAFWRERGLSGEVFSHCGPLSEIYDGSPADEDYFALTSFVGLSASQRQQMGAEALKELCLQQLQRLFGDESLQVVDIQLKDWSLELFTTSEMDLNSEASHPQYPDSMDRSFCHDRIILAGSETARSHGGYLEGALQSAEEALYKLA